MPLPKKNRLFQLCKNHQQLSFSAFFQIKFGCFSKQINNNALDIIRELFKDKSIAVDIFPQIIFFSTFHGLSRLFAKTKFAKTRPKLELLLMWTFQVFRFQQTFKWKYRSQKVEFETFKSYRDQKNIWSNFIPPLNCACLNHSRRKKEERKKEGTGTWA